MSWEISHNGDRSELKRNGELFQIRGVSGWDYVRLNDLVEIGGNAIRAQPNTKGMNEAARMGLVVLANLPVLGEKDGFDWNDKKRVRKQIKRIQRLVSRLKNHPAVMMWCVGNELDHIPAKPRQSLPYNPELWQRVNDLARAVKQVDPSHPVCTCVGMGGFEAKIQEIARACLDVDLIGINNFWKPAETVAQLDTIWKRPYVFSEWGASPPWLVATTNWEAPLEAPSSKKASVISERFETIIQPAAHCIGSFVFYWGERNERTHTWWGLFRDGMRTEPLDVLKRHWTGSWPRNRCPSVLGVSIEEHTDPFDIRLESDKEYQGRVHCFDPESDQLEINWHIRAEVYRPIGSYSGHLEVHAGPIEGLILNQDAKTVRFRTPHESDAYRLFVQVADGQGNAGYANIPFWVGPDEPRSCVEGVGRQ